MIRSLVGAFWPGCFLDFLEADDLPEFFRETFAELAELLPAGLLALFPVAADFVAAGFVAERPAALFAEVAVELIVRPVGEVPEGGMGRIVGGRHGSLRRMGGRGG